MTECVCSSPHPPPLCVTIRIGSFHRIWRGTDPITLGGCHENKHLFSRMSCHVGAVFGNRIRRAEGGMPTNPLDPRDDKVNGIGCGSSGDSSSGDSISNFFNETSTRGTGNFASITGRELRLGRLGPKSKVGLSSPLPKPKTASRCSVCCPRKTSRLKMSSG